MWINGTIESRVFPLISSQYGIPVGLLSIQDIFLVKYDGDTLGAQASLQTHLDSSLMSFNIALSVSDDLLLLDESKTTRDSSAVEKIIDNDQRLDTESSTLISKESVSHPHHYSGGGTRFVVSNKVVQLRQGALLLHPSRLYHSGEQVTRGRRYILVGFVKVVAWEWSTAWRRFGGFTKCLSVSSLTVRSDNNSAGVIVGE
jgi:hypothetical protein